MNLLSYKDLYNYYSKLNYINQYIVWSTLRKMEHPQNCYSSVSKRMWEKIYDKVYLEKRLKQLKIKLKNAKNNKEKDYWQKQIKKYQEKNHQYTYTTLYKKLKEKYEQGNISGAYEPISPKTYESFMARESYKSFLFEDVCEQLNISHSERQRIQFTANSNDLCDLYYLYNSLSKKNKNAASNLIQMLFNAQNYPEFFDEYDNFQYDEDGNELPFIKLKRPNRKFI